MCRLVNLHENNTESRPRVFETTKNSQLKQKKNLESAEIAIFDFKWLYIRQFNVSLCTGNNLSSIT